MAFGDVGGTVTQLVVTCRTKTVGPVAIAKGNAVKLTGPYTVDNATDAEDAVFGEALADAAENGLALPVKVRGISVFYYDGAAPSVDGVSGVRASSTPGKVKAPASGNGVGVNVKVDSVAGKVHVLL